MICGPRVLGHVGCCLLAAKGFAFEMKSRLSPENEGKEVARNTVKRLKGSVAHAEARALEDEIMNRRRSRGSLNATASFNEDEPRPISRAPQFAWETEEDSEWVKPYLKASEFIVLPANHHYSRREWFGKYNDTEAARLLAIAKRMDFVFSLSTGHCGTTTMSEASAYTDAGFDSSACYFGFETMAQGTRDFARRHPGRGAARAFVRRYLLPSVAELATRAGKQCFVDFGHHVVFGHFLTALKAELGPRMTTVRLRRGRLDTATSYAVKRKKDGPCGSRCVYCVCPGDQKVCLPVKEALWRRLTVYMKFLWMVDEVECRWHAYRQDLKFLAPRANASAALASAGAAPGKALAALDEIEVSWTTDLATHLKRLAMHQGFPRLDAGRQRRGEAPAAVEKHKSHVSKKEKGCVCSLAPETVSGVLLRVWLPLRFHRASSHVGVPLRCGRLRSQSQNEAEDAVYRKLMAFTPAQLQMLRPAFF